MSEVRRQFLFGVTVSEVAFFLFFVLLLFTFMSIQRLEEERSRTEASLGEAEQRAQDAEGRLRQIEAVVGAGAPLDLDDPLTILTRAAAAVENAEQKDEELSQLRAERERLEQEKQQALDGLTRIEQASENLRGQVANLQTRAGVGLPPCWVSGESGQIEYLFNVRFFENETVRVQREAPPRRDADYSRLPSVPGITERRLSITEFERLARPIYDTGMASEPECRHFVKLEFADRESCRLFLVAERYFYKVVEPDDSAICTA